MGLFVAIVLACLLGKQVSAAPSSYPEIQRDDFIHSLANVTAGLLKRDKGDLVQSLVATIGAQALARQIQKSFKPLYSSPKFSPCCDIIPCKYLVLGINFSELIYDGDAFQNNACTPMLSDFDVVSSNPTAKYLKPAYMLLRSKMEPVAWVIIRGTTDINDLLTDLKTNVMLRFRPLHLPSSDISSVRTLRGWYGSPGHFKSCKLHIFTGPRSFAQRRQGLVDWAQPGCCHSRALHRSNLVYQIWFTFAAAAAHVGSC